MTLSLPEGVLQADERLVKLTEDADTKLQSLTKNPGQYLRIKITGGGCNGLSYKIQFSDPESLKPGDFVVPSIKSLLVVDRKSAIYLRGTTLDYSHKLIGGGFKFDNPHAKSSCSCGESFSI